MNLSVIFMWGSLWIYVKYILIAHSSYFSFSGIYLAAGVSGHHTISYMGHHAPH
jgi:hypothetical protein